MSDLRWDRPARDNECGPQRRPPPQTWLLYGLPQSFTAKSATDTAADVSENFDFSGRSRKLDLRWQMCDLFGWSRGYGGGRRARAVGAWHVGHTCRAAARLLFEPSVQRLRAHALQHKVIQHLRVQGEVGLHFLICQTWRTQGGGGGRGGFLHSCTESEM